MNAKMRGIVAAVISLGMGVGAYYVYSLGAIYALIWGAVALIWAVLSIISFGMALKQSRG